MGGQRNIEARGGTLCGIAYGMTRRDLLESGALASATLMGARAAPRRLRIGIVGGNFGRTFQWHLHPDCTVTAVCDIDRETLDRLGTTYRCANRFTTFAEMLKFRDLDAVGVFTPLPLHVWMATTALEAGKHVISAVPAGLSLEELERLLDTVKRTGLRYMMAETSYYRPEVITCREWAREGRFGTISYSEAEYHHEGVLQLMFDSRGLPTWRHGLPPLQYPTHCTGIVVPVTGERLTEVTAVGWGDGHEVLRSNLYKNPFWSGNAFFKTSGGHCTRVSVSWHIAAPVVERGQFFGERMSYFMERPQQSPDTVVRLVPGAQTRIAVEAYQQPNHWERLPEPLRVPSGHGGSHTFLTHEFVRAIVEDRHPAVNVWEAIAYTAPGIVAHESALRGGEAMKIRDYGKAPA